MPIYRNPIELSVVVPVWNDVDAVGPFLIEVRKAISEVAPKYEIIFCVDPSSDGTEAEIRRFATKDKKIKALFFASRSGQAASTMAGLVHSVGNAVIVMDVDLQDPVELIPTMVARWRQGSQLVLPRRSSRFGEPITKRATAAIGYTFLNKFGLVTIPKNTGDFRLMDRAVVQRVLALRESHVFLRGLVAMTGPKPEFIDFVRPPRPRGDTKYNKWFGGIRAGLDGIVSFSNALLDAIMIFGILISGISVLLGLKFLIQKLTGQNIPEANTLVFVVVTFIGGIQLFSLGIIGMYVGRIFQEVKNRPRWYIGESLGLGKIDKYDIARSNSKAVGIELN